MKRASRRRRRRRSLFVLLGVLGGAWYLAQREKESAVGIEVTKTSPLAPGENPSASGRA